MMTISSITSGSTALLAQVATTRRDVGSDFTRRLAVAAQTDKSAAPSSSTPDSAGTVSTGSLNDFTNMTPRQLYSTAQTIYRQGKIGPNELFHMQMLAGGLDPNGSAYANNTPVNYVNIYKSQLAGIVSRDGKGDAGYQSYVTILNAIGADKQGGVA